MIPRYLSLCPSSFPFFFLSFSDLRIFGFLLSLKAAFSKFWVMGVFVAESLFLLNPFDFWHKAARMWMLRTIGRALSAPFRPVEFRDFWLADQACSLVIVLTDFGFSCCFLLTDFFSNQDQCANHNDTIIRPLFAGLPFLVRFLQCCRRYYDSRSPKDMINAGKYFTSLVLLVFATLHTNLDSSNWGAFRAGWLVVAVVGTLYAFLWDVLMDWVRKRSHLFFLLLNILFQGNWKMEIWAVAEKHDSAKMVILLCHAV